MRSSRSDSFHVRSRRSPRSLLLLLPSISSLATTLHLTHHSYKTSCQVSPRPSLLHQPLLFPFSLSRFFASSTADCLASLALSQNSPVLCLPTGTSPDLTAPPVTGSPAQASSKVAAPIDGAFEGKAVPNVKARRESVTVKEAHNEKAATVAAAAADKAKLKEFVEDGGHFSLVRSVQLLSLHSFSGFIELRRWRTQLFGSFRQTRARGLRGGISTWVVDRQSTDYFYRLVQELPPRRLRHPWQWLLRLPLALLFSPVPPHQRPQVPLVSRKKTSPVGFPPADPISTAGMPLLTLSPACSLTLSMARSRVGGTRAVCSDKSSTVSPIRCVSDTFLVNWKSQPRVLTDIRSHFLSYALSRLFPRPRLQISFGVAPAMAAFCIGLRTTADTIILTTFICAGIARLARFNATVALVPKDDTGKSKYFEGLPIPSSLMLCGAMAYCVKQGWIMSYLPWGLVEPIKQKLGVEVHYASFVFLGWASLMISKTLRCGSVWVGFDVSESLTCPCSLIHLAGSPSSKQRKGSLVPTLLAAPLSYPLTLAVKDCNISLQLESA